MILIKNILKQRTDRIDKHKRHRSKGLCVIYSCGDDMIQAEQYVSYRNDENENIIK